MRTPRPPSDLH